MKEFVFVNKIIFSHSGTTCPIRNQIILWQGKLRDDGCFFDLDSNYLRNPLFLAFVGGLIFSVLTILIFFDIIGFRYSFPFLTVGFWFILAPVRRLFGSFSQHYFITEYYVIICRNLGLFSYVSVLNKRKIDDIRISQNPYGYLIRFMNENRPGCYLLESYFLFKHIDRANLIKVLALFPDVSAKIWSWKRNEFVWWIWYIENSEFMGNRTDLNFELMEY